MIKLPPIYLTSMAKMLEGVAEAVGFIDQLVNKYGSPEEDKRATEVAVNLAARSAVMATLMGNFDALKTIKDIINGSVKPSTGQAPEQAEEKGTGLEGPN